MDIENLLDQLDRLSSWRKKELVRAQFLAENAENKDDQSYLCRAWVVMMYAHCDNFLKESTRIYLTYLRINFEKLSGDNYKYDLMWLVIKGEHNFTKGKNKNYKSLKNFYQSDGNFFLSDALINSLLDKANFSYTQLRFFCDWIMQVNFEHVDQIDFCRGLMSKRNSIAHGEESYIDSPADCLNWHKSTINFIDLLKDAIIESATF